MEPHDLYGLPLDRFVAERSALAKALRAEGRREEGAAVAKLRKPSVAAWAVNQLVRTQGRSVNGLFEAGDALQRAQDELLAGRGDAQAMREAGERERAAVAELTAAARGLLSSEGHELTQPTLDRVTATLHAAAFDPEARAHVREACLEKELRHVGLGGGGLAAAPPAAAPPRDSRKTAKPAKPPRDRDAERAERAHREQAARALAAARRAETDARRDVDRATRQLEQARARRDRAAEQLREADQALSAAEQRAQDAERAHRSARDALERL